MRVRALLVDPAGRLVLMRRTPPGADPYTVTVGGGVEPHDADLVAALRREVAEETGGVLGRCTPCLVLPGAGGTQHFYVAAVSGIDPRRRTGPEFDRPDRGGYELVHVDPAELAGQQLRPVEFARYAVSNLAELLARL